MRRLLGVAAATAALAALPAPAAAAAPAGSYVIALDDAGPAPAQTARRLSAELGVEVEHVYDSALEGFSADLTAAQVRALRRDRRVEGLERDVVFRTFARKDKKEAANDPSRSAPASAELVPPGVRRIGAAVAAPAGAAGLAVIDTGIDLDHPELAVAGGVDCVGGGSAGDANGHGTHVAGIVAARADGTGVLGVAPGAPVYSVRTLDAAGEGTLSRLLCGIDWVTGNAARLGIRVANMSLGGPGYDDGACGRRSGDLQHQAICRSVAAGVTYVAAAGNSKSDLAWTAPAAFSQVLAVTAMTDTDGLPGAGGARPCDKRQSDDVFASFSNFASGQGAAGRLVAAPGTCIASTSVDAPAATYSGTSQAAPHVAGIVARCIGAGNRGPCGSAAPADVIARVAGDAGRLATVAGGFQGDPLRPVGERAYGPLVTARPY